MSVAHYIANTGLSTKVYLDLFPTPKYPYPTPSRQVAIQQCLRGSSAAGTVRVVDMGAGAGSKTITLLTKYMTEANVTTLQGLYDSVAQVIYSPDDGTTKYTCSWESGDSFIPRRLACGAYEVTIRLRVQSVA